MPVPFPTSAFALGLPNPHRFIAAFLISNGALFASCTARHTPHTRLSPDHPANPQAAQAPMPVDSEFDLTRDPTGSETTARLNATSVPAPNFGASGTMASHAGHGAPPVSTSQLAEPRRRPHKWRSSMNPNEVYDHPGKDSMGMELIPVEEPTNGGEPKP